MTVWYNTPKARVARISAFHFGAKNTPTMATKRRDKGLPAIHHLTADLTTAVFCDCTFSMSVGHDCLFYSLSLPIAFFTRNGDRCYIIEAAAATTTSIARVARDPD